MILNRLSFAVIALLRGLLMGFALVIPRLSALLLFHFAQALLVLDIPDLQVYGFA